MRCSTVFLTVTNVSASSCRSRQLLVKMTVLELRPALAPLAALPLVIVRSWNVLASLHTASVNAADRSITISRNFWLSIADARCQTLKRSSYHLSLLLWLPQTWMQTSPSSEQKLSQESDGHTSPASNHLSKTSKSQQLLCNNLNALVMVLMYLLWFCFRNPPPTLRSPDQWCRSFNHFISQ